MLPEKIFDELMIIEGGHHHDPDDPGGETYCGISRRYHPYWEGWAMLDKGEKPSRELLCGFFNNEYWVEEYEQYTAAHQWLLFSAKVNFGTNNFSRIYHFHTVNNPSAIELATFIKGIYAGICQLNDKRIKNLKGWCNRVDIYKKFL